MSKLVEELLKMLKEGNLENRERIVKSEGTAYQFIRPLKKSKRNRKGK